MINMIQNYATPGQATQALGRGISARPVEGTTKSINPMPYVTAKTNNGLNGPDKRGKPLRKPGETFFDEYHAHELHDVFKFLRTSVPEHEFRTLMEWDYGDNRGRTRLMKQLGAFRDGEKMMLTWASDTVGDGKSTNYQSMELRDGVHDPRTGYVLPEAIVWRNLTAVVHTPNPRMSHGFGGASFLATGAVVMAMPKAVWAEKLGVAPDLEAIARAVFLTHNGSFDPNVRTQINADGTVTAKSSYLDPWGREIESPKGRVDAFQLDTSAYSDTRDMVVVMLNNVRDDGSYAQSAGRFIPGDLLTYFDPAKHPSDPMKHGLLYFLRDDEQDNLTKWLGRTGVHQFYAGANAVIARRAQLGQVKR